MTRRASRPEHALPMLAALAAVLLLAGCADGPAGASADGASPGPSRAADVPEKPPVDRTRPGATAAAYFGAVAQARFTDACSMLAPVMQQRYASAGQDCPTAMAGLFDGRTLAAIGDVAADESQVQVVGDTATIPGSALRRADLPGGAGAPSFPDVRATRMDGAWYLLP